MFTSEERSNGGTSKSRGESGRNPRRSSAIVRQRVRRAGGKLVRRLNRGKANRISGGLSRRFRFFSRRPAGRASRSIALVVGYSQLNPPAASHRLS